MKLKKTIKIGRFNILQVDWFEISKFLSFLSGLNMAGVFLSFFLIKKDYMKIQSLIFGIINFLMFFLLQSIIHKLRDLNPDKSLEVKINGEHK